MTAPGAGAGGAAGPVRVGHVDSLDGLRAVAVTAVLLFHAGVPLAKVGWLGVDLFFVLSGFLITTLLRREARARGRVDLPRFWGRRFLRLMPAYWLYAGLLTYLMFGARWGWTAAHAGWTPALYAAALWGYLVNLAPLGGIWEHQDLAIHLWSLAVEGQYYFAWPVVVAALAGTPWLRRAAWGLVGLILVRRWFAGDFGVVVYLGTRGIGLMLGSAAALTLNPDDGGGGGGAARRWLDAPAARWGVVAAVALLVAAATALERAGRVDEVTLYRWLVPAACPLFAALVAMLWRGPRDFLARALAWRPLAYLGTISYGVYLDHQLARRLTWGVLLAGVESWPRGPRYGLRLAAYLALSVAAAAASYHLLERPFLRLKERLR